MSFLRTKPGRQLFFQKVTWGFSLTTALLVGAGIVFYHTMPSVGGTLASLGLLVLMSYILYREWTQRQRAEAALLESEIRYRSVIETVAEGIVLQQANGKIQAANTSAERILGQAAWQLQSGDLFNSEWQVVDAEGHLLAPGAYPHQFTLETGKALTNVTIGIRKPDAAWTWLSMNTQPLFQERQDPRPYAVILSFFDITERKRAEEALQQANQQLTLWVSQLEQKNYEMTLLNQMSDFLQSCLTLEEACNAIAQLVQPLFPEESGGLFLTSASKKLVEAVSTWGDAALVGQQVFSPHECWALRRGQIHFVDRTTKGLKCQHLHADALPAESLCLPMLAQGEALGLLYLNATQTGKLTESKRQLAVTVAEHIALALSNLKLRESLQNQSIRDPLTGLFNRRYMEESLVREISRAERKQQTVGVMMLDVDHFKQFNDTFGHEAGDVVLRELGLFFQTHIREADIACRYGGEEFTLILPEASLETTQERAEALLRGVKHLNVQYRRQSLGGITLSIGIACFPCNGMTGEVVIQMADAALYRAKHAGRDRLMIAPESAYPSTLPSPGGDTGS